MSPTTKPGVLAVISGAANWIGACIGGDIGNAHANSLEEARATVERLVKADEAYDHAKARRIKAANNIRPTTRAVASDAAFREHCAAEHAYDRAVAERAAALAAFRGESP